jgi:hypothetical protein
MFFVGMKYGLSSDARTEALERKLLRRMFEPNKN